MIQGKHTAVLFQFHTRVATRGGRGPSHDVNSYNLIQPVSDEAVADNLIDEAVADSGILFREIGIDSPSLTLPHGNIVAPVIVRLLSYGHKISHFLRFLVHFIHSTLLISFVVVILHCRLV